MPKKISFLLKITTLVLIVNSLVFAEEIIIIPLKKPVLSTEDREKKVTQNIIKPSPKPIKKKLNEKIVTNEDIVPLAKPGTSKIKVTKNIKKEPKKITKIEKQVDFLVPKSKPLVVKKEVVKIEKESKFYSKKDFALAKKSIDNMEKRQWSSALSTAKRAKDKSIYNFIQWRHLLTKGNQASFYDYKIFIDKNDSYPRMGRIRYLAEHKLSTDKISPIKIIDWFGSTEPLSGYGRLILGESLIKNGEINLGISYIKSGWITAELTRSNMKFFRKKYKKYLDANDYIKRADYLSWENKYWDLKRMLRYLPKDYQLLYTARQILMSKSYGVDNAIKNVPTKLKNDAGLNYDRLKWRRKRGRTDSALEILLNVRNNKDYLIRPEKWWVERSIISRSLIYKKKYELAYKISSKHSMSEGPEFAEAEWMSGWIALSFLNDPVLAIDHFNSFYKNVGYPISLSRGAYWLGRSYEKLGDKDTAAKWYKEASTFMTTYYGQLAHLKINPDIQFQLAEQSIPDDKYKKAFYKKELVKVVNLLDELNKDKYTKHILRHLANDQINGGSEILAAELATNIGRYDFAIQLSKFASYEKRFHNDFNYPVISTPKYINGRKIPEPALILSIIRQESEFDMSANSHAGAKGLMQLMPYTAKVVSKQAKLPYAKSRLTTDPEYNINLGSHYIAGLILEYDGAYPFAIAAYNAGPKRVRYWKKINKNPQKNEIDYVDWIELIKFKETRNYVQRVLENYNVYRYIVEKRPILVKDFFRNNPLF
jgi:soluble lytic murein transglycosylase